MSKRDLNEEELNALLGALDISALKQYGIRLKEAYRKKPKNPKLVRYERLKKLAQEAKKRK